MGDQEVMDTQRRIVLQAEEFDRIVDELERPGRVVTPLGGGRQARRIQADLGAFGRPAARLDTVTPVFSGRLRHS